LVKDQKRWRLLKDFKKGKFCFLISVDNWSVELQKSEFYSLYLLLLKINEQLGSIYREEIPWKEQLSWGLLVGNSSLPKPTPIINKLEYEQQL